VALAMAEARHRRGAAALGDRALSESDRALAMGERARDLLDRMTEQGEGRTTEAELAALPDPQPRPLAPGTVLPVRPGSAYRLPVAGTLLTGFGEVSSAGVRSRGLTFRVAPGAPVRAPAGGTVRFAERFRGYGSIVVVDHGDGWNTLVTGLDRTVVRPGQTLAAGAPLGVAGGGEEPAVTVELRRRGRPVDIAALIG
jgi:septal ring factor EnvC (AmiA/AmiB activator)